MHVHNLYHYYFIIIIYHYHFVLFILSKKFTRVLSGYVCVKLDKNCLSSITFEKCCPFSCASSEQHKGMNGFILYFYFLFLRFRISLRFYCLKCCCCFFEVVVGGYDMGKFGEWSNIFNEVFELPI